MPMRAACFLFVAATFGSQASSLAEELASDRDSAFAARFERYGDALSCWESAGISNPLDHIARAAGGDVRALREMLIGLARPCDGAGSAGEADIVGSLLSHVGDRDFARSLEGLTDEQLDAVVGGISFGMLAESCSLWADAAFVNQFPRTWIALGGRASPGTDRPEFEPLLPIEKLPDPVHSAEEPWVGSFEIDACESMPASIEVTTKGNGVLTVGNLVVRVFDEHDDGSVFYGGLADIERCVIRNKPTLVVRATRVYTTDDEFGLGTQMPVQVVATFHDGKFEVEHDPFGLALQK